VTSAESLWSSYPEGSPAGSRLRTAPMMVAAWVRTIQLSGWSAIRTRVSSRGTSHDNSSLAIAVKTALVSAGRRPNHPAVRRQTPVLDGRYVRARAACLPPMSSGLRMSASWVSTPSFMRRRAGLSSPSGSSADVCSGGCIAASSWNRPSGREALLSTNTALVPGERLADEPPSRRTNFWNVRAKPPG
jgi:hypothetical protein